MAFLDFIKNRQQAGQEQPSEPKPETAKQMYTRTDEQERTNAKPVDHNMRPDQREVMSDVQAKMRGTQEPNETKAPSPAPPDESSSPQAVVQKMENQDKAAPALSPTSMQAGGRASEQETPAPSTDTKAQEQSQERQQTMARRSPSWER